ATLALGATMGLAIVGRLPRRWCLARLGAVLLVLMPFLILLPLVHRDPDPVLSIGALHFSLEGARIALVLVLKTLSLVLLVLVLLVSAPVPTNFKAAQALHVPALLVQLSALTYRYLFVLAGELARLRVALRVRGYRNRPTRHCYRTVGHVAGTLLVRSHERGERVGQAMRCRGFDGRFRSLTAFRTTVKDVIFFLLLSAGSAGLLWWDLAQRT